MDGLIDVVPGGGVNVPPPPVATKRGRKRKSLPDEPLAVPAPPPPLDETDIDGTITTTLTSGSILPAVINVMLKPPPKKRGRKPKVPPAPEPTPHAVTVSDVPVPQNLIHVHHLAPSVHLASSVLPSIRANGQFASSLPPPPPPPPDLSMLAKTHGLQTNKSAPLLNGHLPHVPMRTNGNVFGGAVPPPPPQFALMQVMNSRFTPLQPPLQPLPSPFHMERFGDMGALGFGHGNASFLHHPLPPRRVP
jgi:hypothetical protein